MKKIILALTIASLSACSQQDAEVKDLSTAKTPSVKGEAIEAQKQAPSKSEKLASILASQPTDVQARYAFRHPQETLEFFGIEPGMTVFEALPGEGWYSKILLPYLGEKGQLMGVDYTVEMWPLFKFFDEEFIEKRKQWPATWPDKAQAWFEGEAAGAKVASVSAYTLSTLPETASNTVDAALFIRALHNLARFEKQGNYLSKALQETFRVLKPGGIVGVVQHWAADDKSEEWADGSRGYLKRAHVITSMETAGFELVGESEVNVNPKDQPTNEDIVWRLPPALFTSKEDETLKAKFTAIGESTRMTLKFRKPS